MTSVARGDRSGGGMKGQEDGITLSELFLVVFILGVVSFLVGTQLIDLKKRATESALRGDLGAIRGAVTIYYSDNKIYPSDINSVFSPGSKYLNGLPGVPIPSVPEYRNPGHENVMAAAKNYARIPDRLHFQGEGTELYGYVVSPHSNQHARVFINCRHRDTTGVLWTTR